MRVHRYRRASALLGFLLAGCWAAPAEQSEGAAGLRMESAGALAELAVTAKQRRLTAGFVIVDGVYNTELTAPWDVLEHTLHHAPEQLGIEVLAVSPDGAPVTTAEGLRIFADHGFDDVPPLDILVVPSAEHSRDTDLDRKDLIDWVRTVGSRAPAILSLCWGAFVLAEAELLENRACTTFPSDYDTFAERFPHLDLRINVSFVHAGKVITSQGGARSFDAAMFLVDRLYGREVAKRIGGGLILPWPPEDGTVPYLSSP